MLSGVSAGQKKSGCNRLDEACEVTGEGENDLADHINHAEGCQVDSILFTDFVGANTQIITNVLTSWKSLLISFGKCQRGITPIAIALAQQTGLAKTRGAMSGS